MARYPFSPAILDAMPEELADLYRALEDQLLVEICSRLAIKDQLNEVTVQAIRALRAQGIPLDEIKKAIRQTSKISEQKLDQLLDDVVQRNQTYYTGMIDLTQITQPDILVDAMTIDAIKRQTLDACRNITASMGFLVDNGRRMLPPAEAYQWALDNALMQVDSGVISYNQAITGSIKQLADSGLKTVSYETGHVDQIDVAARRAVMTGVAQLNSRYAEQSMEYIETDLVETEAHAGARDIDGPKGWENHKAWQGKVYRWREYTLKYPGTSTGDYPDFAERCGIGDVQGIGGANCRHTWYPFVEGVSERTWTDEQLAHIDDKLGCTYDGRTYSAYEATQMQRRLEREIRKQKRRKKALEAYGLSDDKKAANARLIRLNKKYREFSKAAGLPEQPERVKVSYVDDKSLAEAEKIKSQREERIALEVKADEDTLSYLGADARDNLTDIVKRRTIKLENGFSCFPDDDPLTENVKKVKPLKSYYDVAMHGSPTEVAFGSKKANMSPRLLASIIRHSKGWNGQNIRLISCSTGKRIEDDYCFAEELANALGVKVKAPNDVLYVTCRGEMYVGDFGDGVFVTYTPNERRRIR